MKRYCITVKSRRLSVKLKRILEGSPALNLKMAGDGDWADQFEFDAGTSYVSDLFVMCQLSPGETFSIFRIT